MQQGGSPFGVPPSDISQYTTSTAASGVLPQMLNIPDQLQQQQQQASLAEAASPISSRPPLPQTIGRTPSNFDELVPGSAGVGHGGFADDDALTAAAGEEAERGGVPGNRWPRQETLALIKIRSEMDAAFRDATLKGPLWEEVSRKLAELGYNRSAKKCKEKFENVHKYYKRTKEGRAGRQDGKSYRFFSQLEALHTGGGAVVPTPISSIPPSSMSTNPSPSPISAAGPSSRVPPQAPSPISAINPSPLSARMGFDFVGGSAAAVGTISFSSNTSSSSSDESDDEETEEGAGAGQEGTRKRKRGTSSGGSSGSSRKMMAFFEGLMKQVMERQEAMQQRFLEMIEKREQDRMIREEAWRRQEMARLAREHELMTQERAMAANRDAAVIAFLQKITGQTIQLPPATVVPAAPPPLQHHKPTTPQPPAPPPPSHQTPQITPQAEILRTPAASSADIVPFSESYDGTPAGGGYEPAAPSSRWPKSEVHALIKLRSSLEEKYQEAGPKGPLWEEISSEMQKLGYNRSSKRCKEKWENINKYFKKVKESSKKRPEDAKTCPYFHQLEALYRKKLATGGSGSSSGVGGGGGAIATAQPVTNLNPPERAEVVPISSQTSATAAPPLPPQQQQTQTDTEGKNGNSGNRSGGNDDQERNEAGGILVETNNGGITPSFYPAEGTSSGSSTIRKPEDIMKELMDQEQQQQQQQFMDDYEEGDSDDMEQNDGDDDGDDDDDDDSKMQYKIQFQRPNVGNGGRKKTSNSSSAATTKPAGSFLAMVQ